MFDLVTQLNTMGHDAVVVTSNYQSVSCSDRGIIRLPGVVVHGKWGRFVVCPTMCKAIKSLEVDLIHIHTPPRFFGESLAFLREVLRLTVPLVLSYHLHNESLQGIPGLIWKIHNEVVMKRVFESVDRIIVPNNLYLRMLEDAFGFEKVRVIPYGIDCGFFDPNRFDANAERQRFQINHRNVIMYAGRLTSQKGVDLLIKALPSVLRELSDTLLIVVGEGELQSDLRALCVKLGVSSSTRFVGNIPHGMMPAIMSLAGVVVLPSMSESFGMVLAEGMAMERPVIGTKVGGIPEIVENGRTGILVNKGSIPELSAAIVSVLSNEKHARQMGRRGREFVIRNLKLETVAERMVDIYSEALAAGR